MDDCRFCSIASHEAPAHIIYEDDDTIAFMSSMPINPGHILVIPKTHEPDFQQLPDDKYQKLMRSVKLMAQSVDKLYKPRKVGELIAGWDIPHTHVHILPMYDYNDITSKKIIDETITKASNDALNSEAIKIRESIV